MANRPPKGHERRAAALIGGWHYPANQGGPIDCESSWAIAQCKEVQRLAFPELERLALEAERQGTQRRAGRGAPTPTLVVLTAAMFREMSGPLPGEPSGPEAA